MFDYNKMVGKKYGTLTVVEFCGKDKAGYPCCKCVCECGEERIVRANNLKTGNTKTCGKHQRNVKSKNKWERVDGYIRLWTRDGREFLVDEEDLPIVLKHTWCCLQGKYLVSNIVGTSTRLHRFLMDAPKDMVVDHINGNTFDNRRSNLRICNQNENARNNKLGKNNKTGYTGVELSPNGRFSANIMVNGKHITKGFYSTFEEAKAARIEAECQYFGDYAPHLGALKEVM